MSAILEVKNLSFSYEKDKPVLDSVSFSVEEGEYVCLVGHNGSGKSTLAKILMGLLPNFEGDVSLFSLELNRDNLAKIRAREGIVFQNPDNQFVGSTVEDDIAFGLENRAVSPETMKDIVSKVAQDVGMGDFLGHEPEKLSGGQKQRVAIAGILAIKPDFIIFDEATAMLDPKGRKDVNAVVERVRKEKPGIALLSITHDVEEAYGCDRVIVLSDGKIVADGNPRQIFGDEELLSKAKLRTPFIAQAKKAFEKKGIHIPDNVEDLASLEEALW